MIYASIVEERGTVAFPEFTGERVYMEPFTQAEGLPAHLSRWQNTVDQMLADIEVDGPIYLMIDQSRVEAGQPQRRPGIHIDGYWAPEIRAHGGDRHIPAAPTHRGGGRHRPSPTHGATRFEVMDWGQASFDEPEAIILATDIAAAQAYVGNYAGPIGDMGDCSQIGVDHMARQPLSANRAYAGNVCFLHESLPVEQACNRTLVRLNVPGWSPR